MDDAELELDWRADFEKRRDLNLGFFEKKLQKFSQYVPRGGKNFWILTFLSIFDLCNRIFRQNLAVKNGLTLKPYKFYYYTEEKPKIQKKITSRNLRTKPKIQQIQ